MEGRNRSQLTQDEKYKLLSPGERKYILMTDEEVKTTYKRADLTKAQYDSRIRRRVFGAIADMKLISETYPERKLERIFTLDQINDIIEILQKASIVAKSATEKTLDDPKKFVLHSSEYEKRKKDFLERLQNIETCFMMSAEITAREELLKEYGEYFSLRSTLRHLKDDIQNCNGELERLLSYLKEKGLVSEYKQWEEDTIRDLVKKLGLSESAINEFIKKKRYEVVKQQVYELR